jgi:hypothetical protein
MNAWHVVEALVTVVPPKVSAQFMKNSREATNPIPLRMSSPLPMTLDQADWKLS